MKTTFRRTCALVLMVLLLSLLFGLTFRAVLRDYLQEEKRETLRSNAATLVNLAAAYDAAGEMEAPWGDFRIALTSAAQVAETDAMICNPDGQIRICACEDIGCIHRSAAVPAALAAEIIETGEVFREDVVPGLYETPHYLEGVPVISQRTGETVAVLLLAASTDHILNVLMQSTFLFFYASVLVIAAAVAIMIFVTKKQARSLKMVAGAAVRFGHGELDTRVPVGGKNTREIDELAAAFNTMAESLAQAEKQRQEFVANVSHELKTPMTTIAGFMDGMLDGTIPPPQHRHYMQLVSDEVRRLSRLIRSMLDISRLQSQGIHEEKKRRFDLCESIGQVLISFERRVTGKNLQMDVHLPDRRVWVKADPDSITQVLYNLTDNAVKFCDAGGRLHICLMTEGGKAKVTISNTGETVPPQELPLLFDRFHKADKSRSADREGVGLGLYIVKTILNYHGEDITVTSQDGVTSFTFTLPLVR